MYPYETPPLNEFSIVAYNPPTQESAQLYADQTEGGAYRVDGIALSKMLGRAGIHEETEIHLYPPIVEEPMPVADGRIVVDTAAHTMTVDGTIATPTITPFRLLAYLASPLRVGDWQPRAEITHKIWGSDHAPLSTQDRWTNHLSVELRRLRAGIDAVQGESHGTVRLADPRYGAVQSSHTGLIRAVHSLDPSKPFPPRPSADDVLAMDVTGGLQVTAIDGTLGNVQRGVATRTGWRTFAMSGAVLNSTLDRMRDVGGSLVYFTAVDDELVTPIGSA